MRWGLIGQRCPKEPEKCGKWKTFQKPRNSSEANKTEGLPQCSQLLFAGGLACYTQEEVGEAVGLDRSEVARATGEVCEMDSCPKSIKPSPHARAGGSFSGNGRPSKTAKTSPHARAGGRAIEANKMDSCPKCSQLLATYTDAEWKPPLYAE